MSKELAKVKRIKKANERWIAREKAKTVSLNHPWKIVNIKNMRDR